MSGEPITQKHNAVKTAHSIPTMDLSVGDFTKPKKKGRKPTTKVKKEPKSNGLRIDVRPTVKEDIDLP